MYFISSKKWALYLGVNYSPFKRFMATLLMLVFLISSWYFFIFKAFARMQVKYQQLIEQHVEQHRIENVLKKECSENEQVCKNHKQILKQFYNNKQKSFEDRVAWVFNSIQKHNLLLQQYAPNSEVKRKWYEKNPVFYVIEGTYKDIELFLEELANCFLIGGIDQCTLQKTQNDLLRISFLLNVITLNENNDE